jgi:[ribosomal protein S18]-alanine N-acetyltransferase
MGIVTIEHVGPSHAAVLAAIHGAAFPREGWGAGAFQVQLEMHSVLGLLDGRGGLLLLRVTADEAEILTIGVIPARRRQGIARALLDEGMLRARGLGVRAIFLEVGVWNRAARALYEATGFKEVGRRRQYYANGEDALILRATLNPTEDGAAEGAAARVASG